MMYRGNRDSYPGKSVPINNLPKTNLFKMFKYSINQICNALLFLKLSLYLKEQIYYL